MEALIVILLIVAGIEGLVIYFMHGEKESDEVRIKRLAEPEIAKSKNLCREEQEKYKKLCAEEQEKYKKLCSTESTKYAAKHKEMSALESKFQASAQECEAVKKQYEKMMADFDSFIKKKCEMYPHLAGTMADLLTLHYEKSAEYLVHKPNPAYTEASRIKELRKETKKIIAQMKEIEYKYAYIVKLYPNITDIFDSGFNDEQAFELETEENTDRVRLLLTPEEYQRLTVTQRNQLALDRYLAGRKSKWQIGRDYELYIGYQYEQQGFRVKYSGILENLEDMGRDLIVTKQDKTYIIQCKNWSKAKTIHEKHIFQLFGTLVLYNIDHPKNPASGVFVTTTQLSDKAEKIAKELNIQVVHKEAGEFPRIKCNINRTTGERIYHLPFDQQYDRTVVETGKGECYALTVKEAESKGFRRAFKHVS